MYIDLTVLRFFLLYVVVVAAATSFVVFNTPLSDSEITWWIPVTLGALGVCLSWKLNSVWYKAFIFWVGLGSVFWYFRDLRRVCSEGIPVVSAESSELFRRSRADPDDLNVPSDIDDVKWTIRFEHAPTPRMPTEPEYEVVDRLEEYDEKAIFFFYEAAPDDPTQLGMIPVIETDKEVHIVPADTLVYLKIIFDQSDDSDWGFGDTSALLTFDDEDPKTTLASRPGSRGDPPELQPRQHGEYYSLGEHLTMHEYFHGADCHMYALLDRETLEANVGKDLSIEATMEPASSRRFSVVPVTREKYELYRNWYSWMVVRGPFFNIAVLCMTVAALLLVKRRRDKAYPEYQDATPS